jgi:hypothetical protein
MSVHRRVLIGDAVYARLPDAIRRLFINCAPDPHIIVNYQALIRSEDTRVVLAALEKASAEAAAEASTGNTQQQQG